MPSVPIRVLLVEDNALEADSLRRALEGAGDIHCLPAASTADEMSRRVAELTPDVVLMDLDLPGGGPLEPLGTLTRRYPDIRFVVISQYFTENLVATTLALGARGYLLKSDPFPSVPDAVRRVCNGETVLSRTVARPKLR